MRKLPFLFFVLLLTVMPIMAQDLESAFMRAAHFSADADTVDVFVNGERTLTGLNFGDISDWMRVDAGSYTIAVVSEGGEAADAVLSQEFTLDARNWATIAVIGEIESETLAFQPIVENLIAIPDGLSRVGLFHGASGVRPVNVSDEDDNDLVIGLGYPGTFEGSDGYTAIDIAAGEHTLTMSDADGETLNEVGPTVLGSGRYYFYAAIGTVDASAFVFDITDVDAVMGTSEGTGVTAEDTGTGNLFIRAGHFSSDAPEVDIYLNDSLAISNLSYTNLTDFIGVTGGIYQVALVPTGGTLEDALFTGEIALFEDTLTLIAAVGLVENGTLDVVTAQENGEPTGVGQGRIGFFQAIPTDALFNLTLDGDILLQGVTYPEIFAGAGDGYVSVDILAAAYTFGIEAPEADIELDAGSITMGSGRYYLFVAVGSASAPNYLLLPSGIPE
jgi:hypothetical protein